MCFSPYLAVFGGGGTPRGLGHNLLMQLSSSAAQKWQLPKLIFFYILTIHNDQISYVKQILDPIHVLFTLFGCLNGGKGLGHNLLMQFFTLGTSEVEIFETDFFDVLTIHNDQISCVKHFSGPSKCDFHPI